MRIDRMLRDILDEVRSNPKSEKIREMLLYARTVLDALLVLVHRYARETNRSEEYVLY